MANRKAKDNKKMTIPYKGKEYEIVFNLNVMETIQEKYGSVEKWGDLVEDENEPKAKDIRYGFWAMINEGIEIYNEDHADDTDFIERPLLTEKQVGRIISDVGLAVVAETLRKTVVDSTKSDEKN
jgi:hypothetical protein